MANKDFLSQFSETNKQNEKPESFREEVRIPVNKNQHINPLLIIIPIISVVIIALVLVIIFVFPHIKVVDFVGQNKTDAIAWIKQQEIDSAGIIFKEEYNFDYDEGIIISQDPQEGKVTKNAKMTFTVSSGADPDEKIIVPDLMEMKRADIEAWIKTNKLSATKISTSYSDDVEEGKVIKLEFTNADETSFTRGTTLKISISKGVKPADQVTVTDFVKKTYAEMETWAKTNKITLKKSEAYSDTVDKDYVISQSVKEKTKINQGETISVVVSKGKAIKMPDLSEYTLKEAEAYFTKVGINPDYIKIYSWYDEGQIVDYSPVANTIINDYENVKVYVSLGNKVDIDISIGDTKEDLKNLRDTLNSQGAEITLKLPDDDNLAYSYSYIYEKDDITSITCKDSKDNTCDLSNAPINAKIIYTVSAGKIYKIEPEDSYKEDDKYYLVKLADKLTEQRVTYSIVNSTDEDITSSSICNIKVKGATKSSSGTIEIYEGDSVVLEYVGNE